MDDHQRNQCCSGDPYAVKQTKEVKDNSQFKDDTKDPKLIANLVKDGNFGMPYLPEKLFAELLRLLMFRDQLNEDRIRTLNRMHREMKIYFYRIQGCFWKNRWSIQFGGAKAGSVSRGFNYTWSKWNKTNLASC